MTDSTPKVLRWALSQLESPIQDDSGVLADLVPASMTGPDQGETASRLIYLEQGRPSAPIRDIVRDALSAANGVVVIVSVHGASAPPVDWPDVIRLLDPEKTSVRDVYRDLSSWGLALAQETAGDWHRFGVRSSEYLARAEGHLFEETEATADLNRRIAETLDEHSLVLAELEDARKEAAQLDEDFSRVTRHAQSLETRLAAATSELEAKTNELASIRSRFGDLSKVDSDLERLRMESAVAGARRTALENRVKRLLRDRSTLRHRLALEQWKRRAMSNRRWWLLGSLVAGMMRRPLAVGEHARAFKKLMKPPANAARPKKETTADPENELPSPVGANSDGTTPLAAPSSSEVTPISTPVQRSLVSVDSLVVAGVLDEMSRASFGPECDLLTFSPSDWRARLEKTPPDLLLVESAWRGNGGSWEYQVGSYSFPDSIGLPKLSELVGACREKGVPTVFWNKEDPVHFEKFKEAAALFDVVFTTDADQTGAYRQLSGLRAHTVEALPFAAQPELHFPGPLATRDPRPVFAGTFYRNRHPERRDQLEMLLDGALGLDLVIYDRMGGEITDSFGYPDRFHSSIVGGVPYEEMVEIYRRHRVFLNTNSVIASPTMFSRRVFELLACGTPVVSTPSRGVSEMFGDIVEVITHSGQVTAALDRLGADDEWMTTSLRGLAAVARRHLYADRLATIAAVAGYTFSAARPFDVVGAGGDDREALNDGIASYVAFTDPGDPLGWVTRVVNADVLGYTHEPALAYQWSDRAPDGPIVARRSMVDGGWTRDQDLPPGSKSFLLPR